MSSKTIAFIGASNGCGHFALRHSLSAGATCLALCRTPSRLTTSLSAVPSIPQDKLTVIQGNAHDVDAVSRVLVSPTNPTSLVDVVVFSIGALMSFKTMSLDDPNVCEKGVDAVLAALERLRREGGKVGRPRIVAVTTTGISDFGRDVPIAFLPLYALLKSPHVDKKKVEERLKGCGEEYTIIRPSLLKNEVEDGEEGKKKGEKEIRVGVEDLEKGVESKAVGYTITREDVGRWIFENLIKEDGKKYSRKAVTITY